MKKHYWHFFHDEPVYGYARTTRLCSCDGKITICKILHFDSEIGAVILFCFVFFSVDSPSDQVLNCSLPPSPPRLPPSPLPQPEGVGAVTLFAQLEGEGENPLQWKEEVHQKCKKIVF